MPPAYTTAFPAEVLARHRELIARRELAVEWAELDNERLGCTVVAPDRTGLFATVAASLSLVGFDIESAIGYTHHDGMALEVFTGTDRFDRLATRQDASASPRRSKARCRASSRSTSG